MRQQTAGHRTTSHPGRALLRPQALVVVLILLVLFLRGEIGGIVSSDLLSGGASDDAAEVPVAPPASPTPSPTPARTPAQPPVPTSVPTLVPTSTLAPTVMPSPSPDPTPTPTPVPEPTVRPPAPPTGVDDEALIVQQGTSGRREVAITFDAGDGRGYTLEILDVLDRYDVRASFGVTGAWVEANPDLLLEIVERGHHVMNHTRSHRSWTGVSPGTEPLAPEERRQEVIDTQQIILDAAGYETAPFFRFPYGDYDRADLALLKELGYDYVMWWNCDSLAWMGSTAADIIERCGTDVAAPGMIVLLHVDPAADFEALPGLIETLQADGYDLVTLEEMIQP